MFSYTKELGEVGLDSLLGECSNHKKIPHSKSNFKQIQMMTPTDGDDDCYDHLHPHCNKLSSIVQCEEEDRDNDSYLSRNSSDAIHATTGSSINIDIIDMFANPSNDIFHNKKITNSNMDRVKKVEIVDRTPTTSSHDTLSYRRSSIRQVDRWQHTEQM